MMSLDARPRRVDTEHDVLGAAVGWSHGATWLKAGTGHVLRRNARKGGRRLVLAGNPGQNGGIEGVNQTLRQLVAGDASAADRLFPVVYDQLRDLADRMLRGGRPDHTLQPTALVHEVFLKMVQQDQGTWKDRAHFLNVCALAMRQILINYARDRGTDKRGGGWQRITLSGFSHETESLDVDAGALHAALEQLAELNPRHYQVVVARFLGGLSVEEAAHVLGVTDRTVKRDWRAARVWLALELGKAG